MSDTPSIWYKQYVVACLGPYQVGVLALEATERKVLVFLESLDSLSGLQPLPVDYSSSVILGMETHSLGYVLYLTL